MPRALPVLALALALALPLAACAPHAQAPPPTSPSPLASQPLPAFRRPTLDGASFDTAAERERVVVVKFFAKYCEPCQRTLPALEKLHRDRPDVVVVGVAEDESEGDARWMVQRFGLSFPVVHDRGNVLSGRFRVSELPVAFVADGKGTVRWVGGPEQGEGALRDAVEWAASGR